MVSRHAGPFLDRGWLGRGLWDVQGRRRRSRSDGSVWGRARTGSPWMPRGPRTTDSGIEGGLPLPQALARIFALLDPDLLDQRGVDLSDLRPVEA